MPCLLKEILWIIFFTISSLDLNSHFLDVFFFFKSSSLEMMAFLFLLDSPLKLCWERTAGERHKSPSADWNSKQNAVDRVLPMFQRNLKQFPTPIPTPQRLPMEDRAPWNHGIKFQTLPVHIDQSFSVTLLSSSPLCD